MATQRTRQVETAGRSRRHAELRTSSQSNHVAGQFIIRFKTSAVRHVAASPLASTATARMAARAMPDEVAGPLEMLRNEAGLQSMKPLFVTGGGRRFRGLESWRSHPFMVLSPGRRPIRENP
ncbi:hypothetical protein JQ609_33350 [Bradyrhizobium sp. AUGA SZCCT0169]|uniref:hypothetical protein n=1 Tax=Bradyrhizobium sp. AUGA SZCCT0169 TaxID=2807663 RepID=UPI001BA9AFB9|nr:hypothetical protein [Bradyrhizobium sp. AUGA SZCCT0169]MBR1251788.1 hypothetical protein [Bradyrhizobium sp. AUGA SZCCT0169]